MAETGGLHLIGIMIPESWAITCYQCGLTEDFVAEAVRDAAGHAFKNGWRLVRLTAQCKTCWDKATDA